MHRIDKVSFKNFKFFHNKETTVNVNEKNLLLYGENGSGKSSVYWGLFTLFQSVYKEKKDVEAYFEANGKFSLANANMGEGDDSYVKLFLTKDGEDDKDSIISFDEVNTNESDRLIKEFSKYASFINFKSLFNHHNFLHREEIDLFPLFDYDILNSTSFGIEAESLEGNDFLNSDDVWSEIKAKRISFIEEDGDDEQREDEEQFDELIGAFNNAFSDYLERINKIIDRILSEDFNYNFKLKILFGEVERYATSDNYSQASPPKIGLRITDNGKPIDKPQSYLNEAKLTAIALAIKFAVVLEKYEGDEDKKLPKLLLLDDIMISMDMGNREMVTNLLLERFSDYQIIFFTHDLNFYKYLGHRIDQKGKKTLWKFMEIHVHSDDTVANEYPVIIDSEITAIDKAKFYYNTKDYTACSLYLRQAIESKFKDLLPEELYSRTDDKHTNLHNLWKILKDRYDKIGENRRFALKKEQVEIFNNSKLLVLNPLAHHQTMELPVYKYEIEQVFNFIEYLDTIPVPDKTILLSKGMVIEFKHPDVNYSIKYKLTSDYYFESVGSEKNFSSPKCKILHWQYEGKDFYHPDKKDTIPIDEVMNWPEHTLPAKIKALNECKSFNVDWAMFKKHAKIENSMCSITFE